MKHNIISILSVVLLAAGASSCTDEPIDQQDNTAKGKNEMTFTFSHPSESRATDTSFESGDVVGLYVTEADKPLEIAGNTVNNERLTYGAGRWNPRRQLYWDEGAYDVYAYYPYLSPIESVTDLPFSVSTDQRENAADGIDGYEASDFLYATAADVEATANPVNLQFRHIMSKLTVRLIKGEDFKGDIPANATVFIHNTVTEAEIDLRAGVATKKMHAQTKTITARRNTPTNFSAVVVPQRIDNRVPLVEVVMDGVSLMYESKFLFTPGMHHIVSLVINKNPDQIKIDVGGEITNWN